MNDTRYTFVQSKSGEEVPAIVNEKGEAQSLHSTVDPRREAERLVSTITQDIGFVVFLGLGGGFAPEAALKLTKAFVVVIDFDDAGIKELLKRKDYSRLLNDSRFKLIVDADCEEIKKFVLENYRPAVNGGIKTIPLRARTECDKKKFEDTAAVLQEAVDAVSADYSVQAHFGIKWFSNIIRNIKNAKPFDADGYNSLGAGYPQAAIVAAGPSLDSQLELLKDAKARGIFVISTDTACGALLRNGIKPDAVVSIDCQHISYYHFIGNVPTDVPLILDIASPPMLGSFSSSPIFFSSGHPLALYVSSAWRPFPSLDTSGGNVTYACLSFAEYIGIKHITLFGADFSYVESRSYARGTYLYPYFHKRQTRLSPAEAQFSAFFYRSPFIQAEDGGKKNYYETSSLRFYRKKLEEKASKMDAKIDCAKGFGAPICIENCSAGAETRRKSIKNETAAKSGVDFLTQFKKDITALPEADNAADYIGKLNKKERLIFTTLLPAVAAVKKRNVSLKTGEIIEEVKRRSVNEIEKVLDCGF